MKIHRLTDVQNLFTGLFCCLAGYTPTTFTLASPISPQRISTRRCRNHCSYSRGALQSTQCAPVCTTLLSTMPCQWVVCLPPTSVSHPCTKKTPAFSNQQISWLERKTLKKEWKKTEGSEIHTSLTHDKACRTDFMKGIGNTEECSAYSLCTRKPSSPALLFKHKTDQASNSQCRGPSVVAPGQLFPEVEEESGPSYFSSPSRPPCVLKWPPRQLPLSSFMALWERAYSQPLA